jgi:GNAT superfamily N-acetyltransferase
MVDIIVKGFETPDEQVSRHARTSARCDRAPERDFVAVGVVPYVALRRGVIAGGAGLRIAGGIAQLAGAATAPEHRRQGIHTALLEQRLSDAGAAESDIAVVTTQPGSKSQQNVQRRGFSLLYTRAVLVKKGPWRSHDVGS